MTHVPPAAASLPHAPRLLLHCRYRGVAGCIVSLAGVAFVARPPFLFGGHEEWARTRAIGTAAGILSAVLGGGSSMTIRIIGGSEPAAVIGACAVRSMCWRQGACSIAPMPSCTSDLRHCQQAAGCLDFTCALATWQQCGTGALK
jgi:drug/metabolite transporter (DMT)-like permease